MISRILLKSFVFGIIFSFSGYLGAYIVSGQTATFPAGCASGLGYSVTTGLPCSGTGEVIERYMDGCDSALGVSDTTGLPCSGTDVAIEWLAGCESREGYSYISGEPCDGTREAEGTDSQAQLGNGGILLLLLLLILGGALLWVGKKYNWGRK